MIKLIALLMFISSPAYSNSLKCSANGTDVYYINGVLTNKEKNNLDKRAIEILVNKNKTILDSGTKVLGLPPVNYFGIHNPSFGLINDAAELFTQSYYARTGKNGGKAIFNLMQNIPEQRQWEPAAFDQSLLLSTLRKFGISPALNVALLKFSANENIKTAMERSFASEETLLRENENITNGIANALIASKKNKRKVLFVSHSQGNAALVSAIKKLSIANKNGEVEYMKKFMGAFHVASPVQPISSKSYYDFEEDFKVRTIRSKQDTIITNAEVFSRNFVQPEFQIHPAMITHDVTSLISSTPDTSGHFFSDTYLSPNVFVRPINTNLAPTKMSDVFTSTFSDLATELEDNCAPVISAKNVQCHVFPEDDKTYKRMNFNLDTGGDQRNLRLVSNNAITAYSNSTNIEDITFYSEAESLDVRVISESGLLSNIVKIQNPCPLRLEVSGEVSCNGDLPQINVTSDTSESSAHTYVIQKLNDGFLNTVAVGAANTSWWYNDLQLWQQNEVFVGIAYGGNPIKIEGPYAIPKCN